MQKHPEDDGLIKGIIAYHKATKHGFGRFADGPAGLDWANQPDPFRRFVGAPLLRLPHPSGESGPSYGEVASEGGLPPADVDLKGISQLLYESLALSAWKEAGGTRWALRVNPSSGNLHPTGAYLIGGTMPGMFEQPFIAHYAPKEHGLELRASLPDVLWQQLAQRLPAPGVLLALSSIHWREAWKYGQRAFRYCQHDVGHAIGAVSFAAAGLGWRVRLLDGWGTTELAALLGLEGQQGEETEHPDCLLAIWPGDGSVPDCAAAGEELVSACRDLERLGKANILSPHHVRWDWVEEAARLTAKPPNDGRYELAATPPVAKPAQPGGPSLRQVVRRRRSAQAMDGRSALTRDAFYHILARTLPGDGHIPLVVLPWQAHVHLVLFVHRVQGVDPGVYMLIRNPRDRDALVDELGDAFEWQPVDAGFDGLYRLASGDARQVAGQLSCGQDIAADGCFSVSMLTRYTPALEEYGAWFYPRLFWECGVIGQLLYLEATASGISATGIGCFFDDPVHEFLGLDGDEFQSLYHFTVGVAVDDPRLTTLAAYPG